MVYAITTNRTFVSAKPIKQKRIQSEQSRKLDEFVKTHKISVQTNPRGTVVVQAFDE